MATPKTRAAAPAEQAAFTTTTGEELVYKFDEFERSEYLQIMGQIEQLNLTMQYFLGQTVRKNKLPEMPGGYRLSQSGKGFVKPPTA